MIFSKQIKPLFCQPSYSGIILLTSTHVLKGVTYWGLRETETGQTANTTDLTGLSGSDIH